jgi:hypothetical protein
MSEYADVLREQFAAVKLRTKWWGVTKAVDDYSRRQMANAVGADEKEVHAKKYLVDTKCPQYKGCTTVRSQAKSWLKEITLPYPDDGIRLLRRDNLQTFANKMAGFTAALDQAVAALQDAYWDIRQERKTALAGMFREGDYPLTLVDQFSIWVEYPSIDPPEYLKGNNERIWQQERQRAAAKLNEAVIMAEQALTDEFQKVLNHLVDRLGYDEMGEAKKFRDGTVDNLREFFGKFRNLSIGSNEQLDELVNAAQAILGNTKPDMLREAPNVRDVVRQGMAAISGRLDEMMISRPSRAISFDD